MSGAHWRRSYAHLDSPVHRAPAWLKLLATLALVIGVALVPVGHAIWTGPVLIAVLVGARASRVPLRAFVARLAVVQPFVLGVAVLALFQGRGLDACAAVAFKTTTCVTAVQLLAHTTPFPESCGSWSAHAFRAHSSRHSPCSIGISTSSWTSRRA